MTAVSKRELPAPPVSRAQILRYMGCRETTPEVEALIDRALSVAEGALSYSVCYAEYDVHWEGETADLTFIKTDSRDLAKSIRGCDKILLFAATVGLGLDRLILRYGKCEPSLALGLQALGAERIEALCDAFCHELSIEYKERGYTLRPRFSAGYGDLPLRTQTKIFTALGCEKQIGLTLNAGLIMSPTKSVTAIIGIQSNTL